MKGFDGAMKLREEGLRDRESWEKIGVRLPSYDISSVRRKSIAVPRWVHFGIGNIFRIFIGGIADTLLNEGELDRGISCAESFDFDLVDRIY
ncbi:MAG: mannitol dehydrogenase family protein, partial [Oribacterium sp.]